MGDLKDKQYRSYVSFNTANALPANYVILDASIRLYRVDTVGGDPFLTHGKLFADIKKGFFGTTSTLEGADYMAAGTHDAIGQFTSVDNKWYKMILKPVYYTDLNLAGLTQFRIRFALPSNGNNATDSAYFCSGNCVTPISQPRFVITYYVAHP